MCRGTITVSGVVTVDGGVEDLADTVSCGLAVGLDDGDRNSLYGYSIMLV